MTLPPKRRARGSGTYANFQFEADYGVPPSTDFIRVPIVSSDLGAEQGLIESDLLGQGREPFDPTEDVVTNVGQTVVPVDVRFFGYWLTLLFGAPATAGAAAAAGTITFSGQPGNDTTITINGTVFTFKASGAAGNEINKGGSLAATLTAAATVLNASAVAGVTHATYTSNATQLIATHDAAGTGGNAFTLAAGAGSNGTVSGATLSGGTNAHTFTSGTDGLPSASIEVSIPAAQKHGMNYGFKANTLAIASDRRGLLNATIGYIAKGEARNDASEAGTVADIDADDVLRFAKASGSIEADGDVLGNVVSSNFSYTNNLEAVETVQPDGEIEGADEGMAGSSGDLVMRFAGQDLLDRAVTTPVALSRGWVRGAYSLTIYNDRAFLPKTKKSVSGPNGIQVTANWQASAQGGNVASIVLVNDVAGYSLP